MRFTTTIALLALAGAAQADSVKGFCERDGKRLEFSDGIAFADAREGDTLTTVIYLTAKPLDRAPLAACAECATAMPENTFMSPRGDLIETQKDAIAGGWMEIHHTGGELDMSTLVNVMYIAADGTHTGIDGGNGRIAFDTRTGTHVVGKVSTEAREAPFNETDMDCDIAFDLAVGWPKP
jgi:hypothetical protein